MPILKIHLLKFFTPDTRLLILVPLEIDPRKLKNIIKQFSPTLIILVDGGTNHLVHLSKKAKLVPIVSVGDGDSSKKHMPRLDILLPVQKDFSDLAFVISAILLKKNNFTAINLMGFINFHQIEQRYDHLLFNIGIVQQLSSKLNFKILMDQRLLFLPAKASTFDYKGLFSVISLTPNNLKLTGKVQYQLKTKTKLAALSSLGLSNIGLGKIDIEVQKSVIIYFAGSNFSSCF
ncbi:MAG: hypothetical protein Q7U04_03515 [Bacteriovorax sp.]|nr:hypothetical protein [Bacteriovorax sp.]